MAALHELAAVEAAAALRRGDATAEAYAAALLGRCRRFAALNAFLAIDNDAVLAAARDADLARASGRRLGALHGLPLAIKDNIDVAGMATTCNSPPLAANRAPADAAIVRRLKAAGALVLGKTNMHELALGSPNDPATGGDALNPYDQSAMTGGSSSGTAVAIAARLSPGGLGTDTGGSVRIPAAHCGIAGLRPTLGRYPGAGMVALCPTRDTAGPMARTVADVALLDAAICGEDTPDALPDLAGVRLGVPRAYFYEDLDPMTAAFAERELVRLREHGATLIDADIDDIGALNDLVSFVVFQHEVPLELSKYLQERLPGVAAADFARRIGSPRCRSFVEGLLGAAGAASTPVPRAVYEQAIIVHRPALRAAYRAYFAAHRVDAIVYPTTPLPARSLSEASAAAAAAKTLRQALVYLRLIDPSSNAGLPGITVPSGMTPRGVPLGLAFDAPEGDDRRLLALGMAYEALTTPMPPPPMR